MESRKRKAEVVDLTADHELASRPTKRPTMERQCVIDLSPTLVDLASDAEAAAAPADSCLPHISLPPSPQVIDSDDDAPADHLELADGHCAKLEEIAPLQDQKGHVGGTAATQGCPRPKTSGSVNDPGVQEAKQLTARAAAAAPAVSAFFSQFASCSTPFQAAGAGTAGIPLAPAVSALFGQYAGASNPFHAAAVLLAATGLPPPQLLQAPVQTASQPPLPAILHGMPVSMSSAVAAALLKTALQPPVPAVPILRAVPLPMSSAPSAAPHKTALLPTEQAILPAVPVPMSSAAAATAPFKGAPQPHLPAILNAVPLSAAAAVEPSAAAAKHSQQPLRPQPVHRAVPGSASGPGAAEGAAKGAAAEPEAASSAKPPQLQSMPMSAAAEAAEGAHSEAAAVPVASQLPHLRPVKVPSCFDVLREGGPSDPALQAAAALSQAQWSAQAVALRAAGTASTGLARGNGPSAAASNSDEEPSSAESSSGVLLAPGEASAEVLAAALPQGTALDKPHSFVQINSLGNTGKAAPGQAEADSPHSSTTESTLMGSPQKAAGAAVCSTPASPPIRAACGATMGVVSSKCPRDNSNIGPSEDARSGSVVSKIAAALVSSGVARAVLDSAVSTQDVACGLPSADVDGPLSTPDLAPGRGPSASVIAAAAAHGPVAAGAEIAAATPGRAGTPAAAAGAHAPGHVDAPQSAGIAGILGAERDTPIAASVRISTGSGAADTATAAPRASAIPDSSATVTDSDVAARADARIELQSGPDSSATFTDSDVAPRADAGTEVQSRDRNEVGIAGGISAGAGSTMAGAGSSPAGGLPRRIRSPPQRLEPTFYGKKHTMAAVGTRWTAEDIWQGSRRARSRRGRGGSKLGGTIPTMFRSSKSGRGRGRAKGVRAREQFFQQDAPAPSAPQARGLQRSAATEAPGQAAGGSTLPVSPKEERDGGDAESLRLPAAPHVPKRRRRACLDWPEDSEACAPVQDVGGVQQRKGSDDIWLSSDDDSDGSEEMAPDEDSCWTLNAPPQAARPLSNCLAANAANAAAVGKRITSTQGRGLGQRTAAEASAQAAADRAAEASPATVSKERPMAEACSQAGVRRGVGRGVGAAKEDIIDRCYEGLLSMQKKGHARRQQHRDAAQAFDQALRSNRRSVELIGAAAPGKEPYEGAGGVSDLDRVAASAAASVVGALRLKQACRQSQIEAEAVGLLKNLDGGGLVTKPARRNGIIMEKPPAGMPNQAAAGPPDQAAAEHTPSGCRTAAPPADAIVPGAMPLPDQAPSGSRAATPSAGASGSGAKPLHIKLTARKTTGGARPLAPAHRVAAPAPCASLQHLDVKVVAAHAAEDIDNELVHEIYSEEVHAMHQQALFDRSRKRKPPKTGLELLPLSHSTIPGKAAQKKAEEAVETYFALTAEQKRAYMRSRVEVFEILAACVDHPAQSFNVATMRHLDPDRQVERGLRAVRDMPAFTLMGEYCGVVKKGDAAEAASAEDPMGFGGLKNDKLKDFCHSHLDKNVRPQGLWSEGKELVVDPCRAGNELRYINDYQGMPGGVTENVATVEVFDHDTLRPHILFFTIDAVSAGQELLMDYGEQFRRFIMSEGNRAKSLVAARKAAAEARQALELANAKAAEAMAEVLQGRDVVLMALQEAEDAHAEAKLARKEARKAKKEKTELENLLKKHGIKH